MRSAFCFSLVLVACSPLPTVVADGGSVGDADAGRSADAGGHSDAGELVDAGLLGTDAGSRADAGMVDAGRDPLVIERPFDVVVPAGVTPGIALPLVVVLHGLGSSGDGHDRYFSLSQLAQRRVFLLAKPTGLRNDSAQSYWNATDACCGFGKTNDDVAYLTAVIRDVQARYTVDPKRIFLIGHSNGGFMAHRMACDRAELIAGIASFAGMVWADAARCTPSQPVSVLQMHGTLDQVIGYQGGTFGGGAPFPSASATVTTWARKNGCTGTAVVAMPGVLNLDADVAGDETTRASISGCPTPRGAELWTMTGSSHSPTLSSDFSDLAYTWLLAHPKP